MGHQATKLPISWPTHESIHISFQEYVTRIAGEITLGSDYWWLGITYNEEAKRYEWVNGDEIDTGVT